MGNRISLEPEAAEVSDANSKAPFIFQMPPWKGREVLEEAQSGPACDRNEITASPLRADIEQLKGLPEAMIINGEADVLRDEGEAYARKLREAGVDVTAVRFQGMIHDFIMLNALDQTKACRAAMDTSVAWLNRKNCCQDHCPG